ncbi:alpha/beta hydrolase [Nocardia concava]|uniref:alpha/beta hydrolase n=1 Tax=Nocardia concava TaxID=257281 RepID=UPI0002E36320|nr:alpha/beta hydrolase [Nocardia concava]
MTTPRKARPRKRAVPQPISIVTVTPGPASPQSRVLLRLSRIAIKPALNALISVYGMMIRIGPEGTAKARWLQTLVAATDYLLMPVRPLKGSTVERISLPDCPPRIERVSGPGVTRADAAVLWFHGGGLVAGGFNSHRRMLSRLSAEAGIPVYTVEFRLLIEHEFRDAVDDAVAAYRALLGHGIDPGKLVIGADSGAAAIAVALAVRVRDEGLPACAGLAIISPWIDFDPTEKFADPRARLDPMIPIAGAWPMSGGDLMANHVLARGLDQAAALSPIRSNLKGLPPFLIHAAETEILALDAHLLYDRLTTEGVPAQLTLWSGQVHVFQLFADIVPEGMRSLSEIGDFVRRITGGAP